MPGLTRRVSLSVEKSATRWRLKITQRYSSSLFLAFLRVSRSRFSRPSAAVCRRREEEIPALSLPLFGVTSFGGLRGSLSNSDRQLSATCADTSEFLFARETTSEVTRVEKRKKRSPDTICLSSWRHQQARWLNNRRSPKFHLRQLTSAWNESFLFTSINVVWYRLCYPTTLRDVRYSSDYSSPISCPFLRCNLYTVYSKDRFSFYVEK